uniref:Uncharacterized protein n=1 Tax=Tetranychus urticae TaxID=32264 RepID=T1L4B6_TETUR
MVVSWWFRVLTMEQNNFQNVQPFTSKAFFGFLFSGEQSSFKRYQIHPMRFGMLPRSRRKSKGMRK